MKKNDFQIGQKVFLRNIEMRRGQKLIVECSVKAIGRRYITVASHLGEKKFDMSENFKEVTIYSPSWALYLSEEEIKKDIKRQESKKEVAVAFRWDSKIWRKLTEQDLMKIPDIVHKHETEKD